MSRLIAQLLIVLACVAGTVYLAANGRDGWGWLVALAILVVS